MNNIKNDFFDDSPINKAVNDKLNYSNFAENLVNVLLSIPENKKYAIAICGQWGVGKTSILNLTKEKLKKKNRKNKLILIDFNPWNITNKDMLIKEFFTLLKEKIPIKNKKWKLIKSIDRYSSLVMDEVNNIPKVGGILRPILSFLLAKTGIRNTASVSTQKKYLSKMLKNAYPKNIIIFMDDLDRLTNEEVLLVFRLIKEIGDFPKISYVLSFDREQVCRALTEAQGCEGDAYLKKFFQMEWNIPDIENDKLYEVFVSFVKEIIDDSVILAEQNYLRESYYTCIADFIKNIRDLKILYNSFCYSYKIIGEEVNFVDLLVVTAFSIYYPELYDYIRNNKDILCGTNHDLYTSYYFYQGMGKSTDELDIYGQTAKYIDPNNKKQTKEKLFYLFPDFAKVCGKPCPIKRTNVETNKYLCSSTYFTTYFKQFLPNNIIKNNELKFLLQNASDEEILEIFLREDRKTNDSFSNLLDILEEQLHSLSKERVIESFKALLVVYDLVEGIYRQNIGYPMSKSRKINGLCVIAMHILGKTDSAKLLLTIIEDKELLLKCYKIISYLLYSENYDGIDKKLEHDDYEKLCGLFISWVNENKENITILDLDGKNFIFALYSKIDKEQLIVQFNDILQTPENFVKLVLNLSGEWIKDLAKLRNYKDFWNKLYPGLEVLQNSELYMKQVLENGLYKKLNYEQQKELAEYCSLYEIKGVLGGKQNTDDVLFYWEQKY